MYTPYLACFSPAGSADLLIMPEKRYEMGVAFFQQRQLRVLGRLVRLRREPRTEVRRRDLTPQEAGHVRPRLLRSHLEARRDKLLQQRILQTHRPARGEVHHRVRGVAVGQLLEEA